ncbi:tRNA (guanine-N(7)-)-methyltransferase [Metamycoplasma arthritidis]|uniref:tRNA (guanine-N(7)-)-methyltransferase n=1 Tax=Metamycoplasma arthritidis (strain 158L3-1) TaxID=243272 RepID=B3PLY6_META1|nr:tRNA (guanosine(46)-N7)-methyltransferase TrmB [Metamycoplasma arthritidis]ACF07038.1 tRNA (guanine-N(7)-)-methyltransferase [Metamycoplasma arthritidis 158L3-1]VEU78568.1 tRNA (guanine-N(7)-)-methyltransferase [Metamycoplasma arthritidis]
MRLRYNKNALDFIKNSPYSLKKLPHILTKDTVLEIGMGKGKMICELAKANPTKQYIGIEKYSTPAYSAIKKFETSELKNILVVVADASELSTIFNGKCQTIWLTFSDPWPKKRHFKRRLVYRKFLEIYQKLLLDDGIIYFKSDNDGLYQFALEELAAFGANIIYQTNDLHNCDYQIENYFTDYEKKFYELGKNINFIAFNFKKN